jgi:hypothetical protein
MAKLTESYLKSIIKQVLKEGEGYYAGYDSSIPDLSVDNAVSIIGSIQRGNKPDQGDLDRIIALLYKLDGREVTSKRGRPAYNLSSLK